MRWILVVLCVVGIAAASFALREHYREDSSPCSINERWDCGIVNHSPYAVFLGIPVAVIGIVGYFLLAALPGLAFSLYLAHIEKDLLGVWCIYCVISLGVISLLTLLALGRVVATSMGLSKQAVQS